MHHEFGHLIAHVINKNYFGGEKVISIRIVPKHDPLNSKMSFGGAVRTDPVKASTLSREGKCFGIMGIIAGCLFQAWYFDIVKPKKGKGFEECFCPPDNICKACNGFNDFNDISDFVDNSKRREYYQKLSDYVRSYNDKNLYILYKPFIEVIKEYNELWWCKFKDKPGEEVIQTYDKELEEKLSEKVTDAIVGNYKEFALGLHLGMF